MAALSATTIVPPTANPASRTREAAAAAVTELVPVKLVEVARARPAAFAVARRLSAVSAIVRVAVPRLKAGSAASATALDTEMA